MTHYLPKLAAVAPILFLSACASGDYRQSDRNEYVTVFYAEVDQIHDVAFDSQAGEAVAVGGVWGALENADGDRGDIIGGAIVGAVFGGIINAIFEGSTKGYEYYLTAVDGDSVMVVLDHDPAEVGECVRVVMTRKVTVDLADKSHCSTDLFD
ncbi:hypothetical protein OAP14_09075 [Aliiglaciecola sp.]|nr:hypothetical protein [Aliiglaciecola sp.]